MVGKTGVVGSGANDPIGGTVSASEIWAEPRFSDSDMGVVRSASVPWGGDAVEETVPDTPPASASGRPPPGTALCPVLKVGSVTVRKWCRSSPLQGWGNAAPRAYGSRAALLQTADTTSRSLSPRVRPGQPKTTKTPRGPGLVGQPPPLFWPDSVRLSPL